MKRAVVVGLCLLVVVVVSTCGCPPKTSAPAAPPVGAEAPPTAIQPSPAGLSLGEQIAQTGVGENGQHVAFTGGSERFASKPGGCLGCHGEDGRGHKTARGETPAIHYAALRGGDKPDFPSDELVIRAIREGKDEEGASLATAMPRWQLNDAEAAALLEYLKELDKAAPAKSKPEAKPAPPAG